LLSLYKINRTFKLEGKKKQLNLADHVPKEYHELLPLFLDSISKARRAFPKHGGHFPSGASISKAQHCDHLLVITEQATKLQAGTLSQNLIIQKIKPHEPKRFDGSHDLEVVVQFLEDIQHYVSRGGAVCQGASKDNQKIVMLWCFLTVKVFYWFENSMKK